MISRNGREFQKKCPYLIFIIIYRNVNYNDILFHYVFEFFDQKHFINDY